MIESIEKIRKRMLDNIGDKYSKLKGDFIYDFAGTSAIEVNEIQKKCKEIETKIDIENLSGEELENRIREKVGTSIERRKATYANGYVTLYGKKGITVLAGSIVSSDINDYIIQENKTIGEEEKIDVFIKCSEIGSVGNVPVGAIKSIPITIAGIIMVENNDAITNGYDAESDELLLQRYFDKIRTPTTSGNINHYKNWAREIVGVGDVKIIPLWDGDNTVKVVIIDSNKNIADEELVEEVQQYIDPKGNFINDRYETWGLGFGQAPIGAFVTASSAIAKYINLDVTILIEDGSSLEQVENDIKNNIIEYLKKIAFKNDSNGTPEQVLYNQIGNIIFTTKGVLDYSNLKINGNTENIGFENEEIGILGDVFIEQQE